MTKAEILDGVWTDVTVSDESLVQCIAEIRRIIGAGARQIVETVPRQGDRINLPSQETRSKRALPLALLSALASLLVAVWVFTQNDAAPPDVQDNPKSIASETSLQGTDVVEANLEVLQGRYPQIATVKVNA